MARRITEAALTKARALAKELSSTYAPYQEEEAAPVQLSDKALEVIAAIDNAGSLCRDAKRDVKKMLSVVLGEDITTAKKKEELSDADLFRKGLKAGTVVIGSGSETQMGMIGVDRDGDLVSFTQFGANDYGGLCSNEYDRVATPAEIDKYFDIIAGINQLDPENFDSDFKAECFGARITRWHRDNS